MAQDALDAATPPAGLDAAADSARAESLSKPPSLAAATKMTMLAASLKATNTTSTIGTIAQTMRGPGRLTFDEICYYRLLDGDVPPAAMRQFVGKRRQTAFHMACNDAGWYASVHDKALFYTIMAGARFPVPETVAISGGRARRGYAQHLASEDEIATFLGSWTDWPLFAKPIDGMFSVGALRISGTDGAYLAVDGYGMVPVGQVAGYMTAMSTEGYLVQRCLTPVAAAPFDLATAVPSVRLLILLCADGPIIESAVVKIPATDATADNYWRSGNLVGALDADTGAITRVVSGVGTEMQVHDQHPVTGAPLSGVAMPEWGAIRKCGLDAATTFPGLRTQSWDIALTARGPVPLEVNFGGDFNLHQIAHRRGMLSERYIEHLGRCGYKAKLL